MRVLGGVLILALVAGCGAQGIPVEPANAPVADAAPVSVDMDVPAPQPVACPSPGTATVNQPCGGTACCMVGLECAVVDGVQKCVAPGPSS